MMASPQVTDGPIGVGTHFLATILIRGGPTEVDIEVTRHERPTVLGTRSVMAGSTAVGERRLEPAASGTRFSWDWDITVAGPARLLGPRRDRRQASGTSDLDRAQGLAGERRHNHSPTVGLKAADAIRVDREEN
jgi:hypothetical protein